MWPARYGLHDVVYTMWSPTMWYTLVVYTMWSTQCGPRDVVRTYTNGLHDVVHTMFTTFE